MTGPSRRVQRFEKEVFQLSSEYITLGLKMPLQCFASVTRVHVSADLRNAKVFMHLTGDDLQIEEDLSSLKEQAASLQRYIHTKLRSKYCPKIQFMYDKSYDHVMKVERILHDLSKENHES